MQIKPDRYYQQCLDADRIVPDAAQIKVICALQHLTEYLHRFALAPGWPDMMRWIAPLEKKRGLYIYGSVGRGKTMLMDIFFASVQGVPKRRIHFHSFMLEIHARLHAARQQNRLSDKKDDAVLRVAAELAREARVLCFDEFQVHNIADAMILSRFFRELFHGGVVVVATSNTAPDHLYAGGLQRDLFLPFIGLIKKRLGVLHLGDGRDYRQDRIKGLPVYLSPLGDASRRGLAELFTRLTDAQDAASMTIEVGHGRQLYVPRAAHGVAWLSFDEVCREAKGIPDFLAITDCFHTVILEDVPQLNDADKNSALRFIHLIDVLYDNGIRLVLSADVPLERLLDASSSLRSRFDRTSSRLMEMQSQDYMSAKRPSGYGEP